MKKILLSSLLMSSITLGSFAETAVLDFSYGSDGELVAFGKGKKETVDVAICINDPSFKGMRVKGITAYVNSSNGLSETSLWMSKDLTVNNKVNIPDIASFPVSVESTVYGRYLLGKMEVTLDEPYVLTD